MNREAVALGVPVYTTYGGRLGGVDESLIRSGRLRPLTDVRALTLQKRTETLDWPRRDPQLLVDLILSTVEEGEVGQPRVEGGEAPVETGQTPVKEVDGHRH